MLSNNHCSKLLTKVMMNSYPGHSGMHLLVLLKSIVHSWLYPIDEISHQQ